MTGLAARLLGRVATLATALALLAVAACERPLEPPTKAKDATSAARSATRPEPRAPDASRAGSASAQPDGPPTSGPLVRQPAPKRLVAVGDLHGDLAATRRVLRLAGVLDEADHWAGGDAWLVQTGDQIDRGDDDRAVLDLFERLPAEAQVAGGRVLALLGNHELMNVALDFRYVASASFASFVGVPGADPAGPGLARLPEPERARAAAFRPGGPYARLLAMRPLYALVGDSVFVHGGLTPKHVRYGLDGLAGEVGAWLRGEAAGPPALVAAEDGPVWLRRYSAAPDSEDCRVLADTLAALGARRMVVGHTVQRGGVSSACDERVWRIDVGLSASYGGKPGALAIEGDRVTVIAEP
ncbi:MAG: metallophosphoesterase [Myxococcales bacterium]|nr:metallophosphoesterase [Myxococcales bacterium]